MLAIITGPTEEAALRESSSWKTFDPEPGSEVVIFDGQANQENTFVRLAVIDWASKFELEALVVDDKASIEPSPFRTSATPQILVIGDSISCGMAISPEQGGEPVPFGVLDAFPFVAQRLLLKGEMPKKVDLEFIGYPGMNLVPPTEQEKVKGFPTGMADAFFWTSPWSKEIFSPLLSPTVVLIELGTNDQAFDISKERFGAALSEFMDKLIKSSNNSIRQVWLVPPFPDADTDNRELNIAMPSFIPLLEAGFDGVQITGKLCNLVEGLTIEDTVDGVHPSLGVHKNIGRKLMEFMACNLYE
ncbi:hypothetical protein BDZ97DRAFT_1668898 [Flammula alnicola]|nr:hypothetical protein BDZ97DRAFT_1668898 [Flammula alnicola]